MGRKSEASALPRRKGGGQQQRRAQLRAVAESHDGVPDTVPEAGRIFGKLRQIFGLSHD
ncbi:hypothetical protein P2318_21985 [Myxococcaceae bacterium GXIMD 01537]